MKLDIQPRDDHQVDITLELPLEIQERYMRRAAREISKSAKIPGFRPGKAPFEVIKRHFGDKAIEDQTIDLILEDYYPKTIEEAKIDPSGPGTLAELPTLNPPIFKFIVPLMPEVILCDYREIRKDYHIDEVTDQDVEHVLTMLQFEYATAEAVEDRAVKENDRVHISLSAELVDPEEDEEKDIVTNQSLQVITNQEAQSENEWPFPEFWKELVGLAINDKKKINHTYDDQAPFEKLRGKSVEFNITVDSLYALILPDLNDEFAHQVNDEFHTLSEFQEDVRKQLQENRQAEYDDQYIDDLIKEIVENSEVKYSPNTLEDEVNETIEGLERNLGRQGLDLQAYLSIIKKDKDTFVKEDIEPAALKRLKRSFVIQKIIESEDIQLDSEQLEFEVSKTLHALGNTASQRNLPKGTNIQDLARAATYETANRMLNNRVLSLLKSIASGEADIQQDTSALEDEITDDNQESTENISENVTDDKPEQTDTLEK